MRVLAIFITTAWIGCASPSPPASPASSNGPPDEPAAEASAEPTSAEPGSGEEAAPTPVEAPAADVVELTRGKRIETHGVRIMLRGTRTEHQADASEVVHAELEVKSGDEERKVNLVRPPKGEPEFVEAFDLTIALESVDAASKPSTAKILIRK